MLVMILSAKSAFSPSLRGSKYVTSPDSIRFAAPYSPREDKTSAYPITESTRPIVLSSNDSARNGSASSYFFKSSARTIPIVSLYTPPALFFFSSSILFSYSPRIIQALAISPLTVCSLISGSGFCEIRCFACSYNSRALLVSAWSLLPIPKKA